MKLKVNLHAHSSESPDACLSPRRLAQHYRNHGYDVIAITDHNRITEPPDVDGITTIKGVEWSIGGGMQHLLEYPDLDLRILPHPNVGGYVGDRLTHVIHEYDVDGVEIYNRGLQTTLRRDIPEGVFGVSHADFHHPGDESSGHFWLRAPSRSPTHIAQALKSPDADARIRTVRTHSPLDIPAVTIASTLNLIGLGRNTDHSNQSTTHPQYSTRPDTAGGRLRQIFNRPARSCPECNTPG